MSTAAPIQRYSDPRLNGSDLTISFSKAAYKFKSSLLSKEKMEAAFDMLRESPKALGGRVTQIFHYHSLSPKERELPEPISVGGLALPPLKPVDVAPKTLYLGGSKEKLEAVVSNGFDITKTRKSAILSDGVYLTPNPETAAAYGGGQVAVSLDVLPKEIAYLDPTSLALFRLEHKEVLAEPNGYNKLPLLFLKNGYKGIEYDLFDWKRGVSPQRALVVYDPACISIKADQASE